MNRISLTMIQQPQRKRSRATLLVVVATLSSLERTYAFQNAVSPAGQPTATKLQAVGVTASNTISVDRFEEITRSYYDFDEEFAVNQVEVEEEAYGVDDVSMAGFQQLQKSTGSEILPSEMLKLIEQGPKEFLREYGDSALERIAMSSITEQLPQKAVEALSAAQKENANMKKKIQNKMFHTKGKRVTPEQEILLAKTIQEGSSINKIRTDALDEGVELSRQEWAERAGLSTKELRRKISNYRKAKHELVEANLGLVHAVVNRLWSGTFQQTGITKHELIQEGSLGLLRAAELFDPERGLRFSTYAVVWIKGTLSNSHVPELVRLPQREKVKWSKILKAQRNLAGHIDPSDAGASSTDLYVPVDQLASETGLTVAEIVSTQRKMKQAQQVLSMDYTYQSTSRSGALGKTETMHSGISSDEADMAESTQLQADLLAAMASNLDAREGRLMRLRYGLTDGRPRTLTECAEAMGLSYSRVYQLSTKCLKKLREAAEAESLEEYLLTIA